MKRWRTVAISTGEMDIETFLSAGGLKVKAGQLVRLLNLPMEKSVSHHEYQNGKQHADALKEAYQTNHGAAGREWIKWLASHQQEAKQAVRAAQERWRGLIPADYGEQVHRVGERFAILEAALVLGMPVTGWGEQESQDAISMALTHGSKSLARGTVSISRSSSRRRRFLMPMGLVVLHRTL